MARPRAFSEPEVLDRAMEVFWKQGYEATSIDDLVDATELSRSSIYQAFGNKRGLLDAAIARYEDERVSQMLGNLERDDGGLDAIVSFFRTLAEIATEYPERAAMGCLMTNMITELGNTDPELRPTADAYIDRLRAAFATALRSAEEAGEVDPGFVPARSELLATLALGTFVRGRGNLDPSGQRGVADAVTLQIDGWRAEALSS